VSEESSVKEVLIRRINPNGILPQFANDFLVNHNDTGLFFTFSVVEPPALLSPEEWSSVTAVDAVAIAKIVMQPAVAKKVARALVENLQKYEGRFGEIPLS